MDKTFFVLSEDSRSRIVADTLTDMGMSVIRPYQMPLEKAVDKSDIVLLGLPMSPDGETIDTASYDKKIYVEHLALMMNVRHTLIGGKISDEHRALFEKRGIRCEDYLDRDEMAIANAVPSAEGALEIILRETDFTVNGSRILVVGYGKIGKYLADILSSLGAHVSVSARKNSDFAWIKAHGFTALHTSDIHLSAGIYDVIVNTVPSLVIDRNVLNRVSSHALILDLASLPGGVDFDYADEHSLHAIRALSLPGKTAPKTAGKIICDTVIGIAHEI